MSEPAARIPAKRRSTLRRLLLPTWEERKRMFAPQAWLVVVGSYAAIGFAFACPQDFRSTSAAYVCVAFAAFLIRTFLFHLGLLLLVIAFVAGLTRRWWLLGTALPLVAFTVGPDAWSYRPKARPTTARQIVRIMSVNLLGCNQRVAEVIGEVRGADPDLLVLQEYRPHWHRAFHQALQPDYPHNASFIREDDFGLAIYSRLPFAGPVDFAVRLGDAGTPQARSVLRLADRDVALYNVHLMPPKGLSWVMEQRREFADLLELLGDEELPVIFCGDFNFTNASVFADELARLGLIDAHRSGGRGRGATWPVLSFFRYLPGIRLDHVFLSKELTSTRSWTGVGHGSDHRPVIAEIGFRR
jgi:endonuclease/exonuclease/phosphatase (EEP) superfamily protein YafD